MEAVCHASPAAATGALVATTAREVVTILTGAKGASAEVRLAMMLRLMRTAGVSPADATLHAIKYVDDWRKEADLVETRAQAAAVKRLRTLQLQSATDDHKLVWVTLLWWQLLVVLVVVVVALGSTLNVEGLLSMPAACTELTQGPQGDTPQPPPPREPTDDTNTPILFPWAYNALAWVHSGAAHIKQWGADGVEAVTSAPAFLKAPACRIIVLAQLVLLTAGALLLGYVLRLVVPHPAVAMVGLAAVILHQLHVSWAALLLRGSWLALFLVYNIIATLLLWQLRVGTLSEAPVVAPEALQEAHTGVRALLVRVGIFGAGLAATYGATLLALAAT